MTARPLPGAELCVHCGFCLQACPTYLTLDDENDSPRGRIVLMKALAAGTLDGADSAAARHLDQCLGCRACETACPSGVPYGQLLETTRAALAPHHPRSMIESIVLFVFARGPLLRAAMAMARLIRASGLSRALLRAPGRVGIAMATIESTRRASTSGTNTNEAGSVAANATGSGAAAARAPVAVLTGCVMEGLLAPVNRATERTLARNGYAIRSVPNQRCCGALHAHAGDRESARTLARANIAAFAVCGAEFIAVNSAGCGAAMKDYGHLLADDAAWRDRAVSFSARVRDVSELLATAGPVPVAAGRRRTVAVDHPCHLVHGQRLTDAPARLLGAITGMKTTELPDAATCCGSAGLYSLAEPALSQQILAPKLAGIAASGATTIVTGNPGCMMHIGAGLLRAGSTVAVLHPVELLDEAYRAADEDTRTRQPAR